jgi:Xaa-Pro aminopeptidase
VSDAVTAQQGERAARVAALLAEQELDALLVDRPVDLRYVTGFTGSHGLAILRADPGEGHVFFTDFRYRTQSAEQILDVFAREIVAGELLDAVAASLSAGAGGRLAFDASSLTVAGHGHLRELLADSWELVASTGLIAGLRRVKDRSEIGRLAAAAELADAALGGVLEAGLVGRSEREIAIELELRMRRLGAEEPSFPSIVASGAHGALPHAEPRDATVVRDTLVTIDWGGRLDGYCSDCTRTYATGEDISALAREVYELVLGAQRKALGAVRAGPTGREVDAVAREAIKLGGHGEHFGHGLGHGVGMEVHEGPRLSRTAGDEALRSGNVVTVEPGVYIPGELGVRIEDLVVVTDDGHELLTGLSTDLTVVA